MSKVSITRSLLDDLATSISVKSGEPVPMTLAEMKDAVDDISSTTVESLSVTSNGTYTAPTGKAYTPVTVNVSAPSPTLQSKTHNVSSAGTTTITADVGYDGLSDVEVSVPSAGPWLEITTAFSGSGNNRTWTATPKVLVDVAEGDTAGFMADGYEKSGTDPLRFNVVPSNTTITPTESAQTIGGANYMMEGAVTVNAIPSNYVGSGITQRSSTDLTASGATVTVPSGYYASNASKTIPNAEPFIGIENEFYTDAGVTKWRARGNVEIDPNEGDVPGYLGAGSISGEYQSFNAVPSNVTITPSTSAQIVGGTRYMMEGAVTVSAMPSGTAGTPTATKGSVSNHSVSVTPSVTNTTGYITGSTKTGTAVTVSASELVSGSETKTANGTYDVTNLAELVVNVSGGGGSSMNCQVAQSTTRATSTSYTEVISLTCPKTGTYDVYWTTFRTSTSGTWGSQLYINDTAYGTAQTGSWSNHVQNIHLSNVSLTANQEVAVRVRSRGSNYYGYVGTLTIKQTA